MAAVDSAITTLSSGTRTNSSWLKPSGLANDDYLVLILTAGATIASGNATVTPPTGFTNLNGSSPVLTLTDPGDVTWNTLGWIFYKKITSAGGEPASYATTHASAGTDGILIRVSGADLSNPFTPTFQTNTGTGLTTTFPSLVGVVANSLVVAFSIGWDGQGGAAPTGTTPTYTEEFDSGSTGAGYVADGTWAAGGTTGTKTNANGNFTSGTNWRSLQLAMQPPSLSSSANTGVHFPANGAEMSSPPSRPAGGVY